MTGEPGLPGESGEPGEPLDRFVLPLSPIAPRQARVRLAAGLAGTGFAAELAEIVVLLASELVTNAVVHGRGEPVLEIRTTDHQMWVGVQDPDSRLPQVQQVDTDSLGGRGMHLVAELAETWGADVIPGDGKVVWFRMRRESPVVDG
ncbi:MULTISPECIES: ATP-binding protein [unclassified Frankia]